MSRQCFVAIGVLCKKGPSYRRRKRLGRRVARLDEQVCIVLLGGQEFNKSGLLRPFNQCVLVNGKLKIKKRRFWIERLEGSPGIENWHVELTVNGQRLGVLDGQLTMCEPFRMAPGIMLNVGDVLEVVGKELQ